MTAKNSFPPKKPLVFHVGVTGHRELSPEASKAVAQSLALVIHHVKETATAILTDYPAPFIGNNPILRCISPLAKGADQLMAHEALAQGYELQTPLPFHREEYAKDFTTAEVHTSFEALLNRATTVFESDGDPVHRDEAYLQAGLLTLEQSDLLVAVWDVQRKPWSIVGTARIVAEARQHNIPVLIIDPGNNGLISLDWQQQTASWQEALTGIIQDILYPFNSPGSGIAFPKHYFEEKRPRHNLRGSLAALIENSIVGKFSWPKWSAPQSPPSLQEEWCHFGESILSRLSPQMTRVEQALGSDFSWADQLALYYGARYRSLAILRFLMPGLLVIGLLIGFYSTEFNALGFGLQVFGCGLIIFLSQEDRREKCHQKFLDYRYLAEHLRHMRYLALLGRTMTAARIPVYNQDAASVWVNWHFRNIVRSMGLISCKVDDRYLDSFRKLFIDGMLLEQKNCQGQVAFYADRQTKYSTISRRLEIWGKWIFWIGLAAICIRAAVVVYRIPARKLWDILALALPALAPIFFGLQAQGEYDRIARRYQAMEQELRRRINHFSQTTTINSARLGQFAKDIAERLVEEVSDWRILVRTKNIKPN